MERAAIRRRGAFRPGTLANVRSHVLLYVAFVGTFGLKDFPATVVSLQAFAEFLWPSCIAPKSVFNALASVKHFHLDFALDIAAFESRKLQLWRRALVLNCRHVPLRAPPLTLELLEGLVQLSLGLGEMGRVMAALMSILFASMARLSSLLKGEGVGYDLTRLPTFGDVRFWEGIWQLRIKWAKAHQEAWQGFWVPLLARKGALACPVERWLDLRDLRGPVISTAPLFWVPEKRVADGRGGRPLTMSVAREWLGVLLSRLGRSGEGFSFHSFRRGACTTAFGGGASESDICQLGGWRSEAVRAYLPARLSRKRAAATLT